MLLLLCSMAYDIDKSPIIAYYSVENHLMCHHDLLIPSLAPHLHPPRQSSLPRHVPVFVRALLWFLHVWHPSPPSGHAHGVSQLWPCGSVEMPTLALLV